MVATFHRTAFRIVHMSIQNNHVHLIIEADDRMALARGMQGFQISAAKHINAAIAKDGGKRRRGCVFADRYHVKVMKSRRGVRNGLAYVLNNWRHHGQHLLRSPVPLPIDPFSTAPSFDGWSWTPAYEWPVTYEPLPVWEPKTWLLREGWKMHGLIDPDEVPGPKDGN
jgi:hypothetical protein